MSDFARLGQFALGKPIEVGLAPETALRPHVGYVLDELMPRPLQILELRFQLEQHLRHPVVLHSKSKRPSLGLLQLLLESPQCGFDTIRLGWPGRDADDGAPRAQRAEEQGLLFWSSCGGEDGQTLFRGGAESFAELREGLFAEAFGEEREEGVTDERQVGQQVGLARAGTVFAHQDIASPMIADFGSAPMSSDQVQPFLGRILIRWRAGEVA